MKQVMLWVNGNNTNAKYGNESFRSDLVTLLFYFKNLSRVSVVKNYAKSWILSQIFKWWNF